MICVYIARCCAPFTLAHKNKLSTASCGDERNDKLERRSKYKWQLKKVERRRQRKRVEARRRAEARRPQRRDRSNQRVTAATLSWRTPTSEGYRAFTKGTTNNFNEVRRSFRFVRDLDWRNMTDTTYHSLLPDCS